MNLIVFDIDGTLTQTNHIDTICFTKAIENNLHIQGLNNDWATYRYSTDSGLLTEIYHNYFGRMPTSIEQQCIQDSFVTYLKNAWANNPTSIQSIPGAETIFHKISQLQHWQIGIATGGWQQSALFKLNAANIPHETIPKAYANDHIERMEIIKVAINKVKTLHNVKAYQHIIYVGDRHWDAQVARKLNIGFIAIGDVFKLTNEFFTINNYTNDDLINYLTVL
jgi:phosphoglycolate phosphatase-like HAD superfamily hydrolase